jgi:hypothetical protein
LLILYPPNWFGHVGRIFQGSRSLDLDVAASLEFGSSVPLCCVTRNCSGVRRKMASGVLP